MKQTILLGCVAALSFTSCINDSHDAESSNIVRLAIEGVGAQTVTRANTTEDLQNTQFVSGKSIYVEAYETGETTTYTTATYTTTSTPGNTSGSIQLSGTMYYPSSQANIDICAYYPSDVSSSTTTFYVGDDQTTAAKYQLYDLMYATRLTDKAKGSTHALTFNHALTKIVVNLKAGNGLSDSDITGKVTAVKINNTILKADLTISGGEISASKDSEESATDIDITGATKTNHTGIIVPQTLTEGTTFITVTYNNNALTYAIPSGGKTFAAGAVYTYNFTVNAQGILLESTEINNWNSTGEDKTIGDNLII